MKWTLTFLTLGLLGLTLTTCEPPTKSDDDGDTGPDTTSHNFTFRVDTLGQGGSLLRDAAIINDTCIWVVGDITTIPASSLNRYNAARWNGKEWMKYRIKFKNFTGTESVQIIHSVLNTNDGNIVFISEIGSVVISDIYYQNIIKSTTVIARSGTPSKSWGTSSSDFYFVGTDGSITHYNGQSFSLLESGTDADLTDIAGSSDGSEIWVCGDNRLANSVLLRKGQSGFQTVYQYDFDDQYNDSTYFTRLVTLFMATNNELIVTGGRYFFVQSLVDPYPVRLMKERVSSSKDAYIRLALGRMRGSGKNDIYAVGQAEFFYHYNGASWQQVNLPVTGFGEYDFWSMDVLETLAVAVGRSSGGSSIVTSILRSP